MSDIKFLGICIVIGSVILGAAVLQHGRSGISMSETPTQRSSTDSDDDPGAKFPIWYHIAKRLEEIVIPRFSVTNIPASEALQRVSGAINAEVGRPVSVMLRGSVDPPIHVDVTNASAIEVFRRVAHAAGMTLRVQSFAVTLCDHEQQELVFTAFTPSPAGIPIFKHFPPTIVEDGPARQWCYDPDQNLVSLRTETNGVDHVIDVVRELGLVVIP